MVRRAAAFTLALALNPMLLCAQDAAVITVTVPSADVYKAPSNVTPVIGHVSRGTVLPVSRNLGSWVKVPWPAAPDGIGYVHVTMGRIGPASVPTTSSASATTTAVAPRASSPGTAAAVARRASSPETPATATAATTPVRTPVVRRAPANATPASHIFGIGGVAASTTSFGATARAWRSNRLGMQLGLTRERQTADAAGARLTATNIEPGVVYALLDHVTDYVWFRPYVGSTLSFHRQTLSANGPAPAESTSDRGIGFRMFGGGEITFASLPRFGVSADLGYRRLPAALGGIDTNPLSVSIAGHVYIK